MKNILFIVMICFSQIFFSQSTDKNTIMKDANSFVGYFETKNIDAVLDMTYPAIFEKVDRDALKKTFENLLYGNEEFKIELGTPDKNAMSVSDVYSDSKSKYAFVSYPMTMKMTLVNQKLESAQKDMMSKAMEAQGYKVKFLNDQTLQMDKLSMIVAINDPSTKSTWKYINYDDTNQLFVSVLSTDIMKKAKEHYSDILIKEKEDAN